MATYSCELCGSTEISITPVPGMWLQYSCDDCDHWWWETQDGKRITPTPEPEAAADESAVATPPA